jgi:hypothetical protein
MKMSSFATPLFMASWSKIFNDKKDLSPRLAYKAKMINDYLADQNKKFSALRMAIIKKYGKKDENGELLVKEGQIEFETESLNDINKEFAELMLVDLEPAPPGRLKAEDLEKDGIKLSGPDVSILAEVLDFGNEAKPALTLVP